MKVDFGNIYEHIIPLNDFDLKYYDHLPPIYLDQLKPLDNMAATFLWNYISDPGLHDNVPFKTNFFKTIDKAKNYNYNKAETRKWLYHRGVPFD